MLTVRKSEDRGKFKNEWLDSKHTFSFSSYIDRDHMNFGHCRVINDDIIAPSGGFDTHGHKDMEIVTYVITGELAHKDSMGNVETIKAGEVQRMSAGTGIEHSEFNYSDKSSCRLLQIWFFPKEEGAEPGYQQQKFSRGDKLDNFKLVVSKDAEGNTVSIGQDVNIYASIIQKGKKLERDIDANAKYWLQIASGNLEVNGLHLDEGDGLAISEEDKISITGVSDESEFLLFEMFEN